jgi:hypothetical protein
MVIDDCGLVVEMNRAAEAIVQLEDGLLIRDGRCCARRVFETAKVANLRRCYGRQTSRGWRAQGDWTIRWFAAICADRDATAS